MEDPKSVGLFYFAFIDLILDKADQKKFTSEHLDFPCQQIVHSSSAWIHYLSEEPEVRASVAEKFCKK